MLRRHGEPLLTWPEMSQSRQLLKEQPLSDQTLKWRACQQDRPTHHRGHITGNSNCCLCKQGDGLCAVPHMCNPQNFVHINEPYISAAFTL